MSLLEHVERAERQTSAPPQRRGEDRVRDILGVPVAPVTEAAALARLHEALLRPGSFMKLAFCNAHAANVASRDAEFRAALARMLVLPDGVGVDIAGRLVHGRAFPANLNGTDLVPKLIATAPAGLRIGLLGARLGVAERAAAKLAALDPRHEIRVLGHGYFDAAEEAALLARLAAEPVDLLLVAFGNPLQELWIDRNLGPGQVRVAAAVGALLDFLAGEVPRAPLWLRRLRLEWLYRLAFEPGRLWRRYVLGNPAFLMRALAASFRARRKRRR